MTALQPLILAVRAGERNAELLLVAAAGAFAWLAWRALERAAFAMPTTADRTLTQFLVTVAAAHVALRLVAPRASAVPFATAAMLSALGVAFVLRLEPSVANDQANWITLGAVLMVATAFAGRWYPLLAHFGYTSAAAAIAVLLLTGLAGDTINGARLWVTVAGQQVQTTEIIKVLLVLFLAAYLADTADVLANPRFRFANRTYSALPYLVPLVLTLALTIGVLALLRDLGSVALLVLLAVGAVYFASGRLRYVVAGVVLLGLTATLGYLAFDHAKVRIDTWLDPHEDAAGAGYQTVQSTYAIQAGGITGAGLGLGEPDTVPAAPTDYIYAGIAEELGMAGALAVVLLYLVLLAAGLRVSLETPDAFGRLLAAIIGLLFAVQAGVIIAGNLRLIPTTGITLPFVSYGGSSLVVNFMLIGLLLAVSNSARSRHA